MRLLAIGDIHGCLTALEHLLDFVAPVPGDTIVSLGDYVDRGPDSKGVLDRLIELHREGILIPLRGNHELMMLGAYVGGQDDIRFWLSVGGIEAMESYQVGHDEPTFDHVPEAHWDFIKNICNDWHETEDHLFVHASLKPYVPIEEQRSEDLHWGHFTLGKHVAHISGKTVVCGHTQQNSGVPLDLGTGICIDTFAYGGGWLTCLDVISGEYWQTNELGNRRRGRR